MKIRLNGKPVLDLCITFQTLPLGKLILAVELRINEFVVEDFILIVLTLADYRTLIYL